MFTILVIFILCISLGVIYRLLPHGRCTTVDPLSKNPTKRVLQELFRIKKNISKNSCEDVSTMLSGVLKRYLAYIFSYIHTGMTNTEIIEALRRDTSNDWRTISQITEILSLTERVNFAKKQLSVTQQIGLYKKTGYIILKIWESKRRRKHANQ